MQLITALLLLAAGHAVRAANDAQCAALGDAARADVCARDADFYAFAGADDCGAALDTQIFESVEATCDGDVEGVEFEDSSLPGVADYYEFYCDTRIENTTRDDQYRTLADVDELPVLRRRCERRARPCCVPRGCRRKLHDFRQRRRALAEEDPNKKPSVTTDSLDDERRAYKAYLCAAVLCGLPDELSDPTSPVTCARAIAVGGICVATVTCYCYKEELRAWLQARQQARRSPPPPQGFGHGDPEESGGEQATQDESRGLTALADAARTDAGITALADAANLQRGGRVDAPPGDAGMPPPRTTESDAEAARTLQGPGDAAPRGNDATGTPGGGRADTPPGDADAAGALLGLTDEARAPPGNGTDLRRSGRVPKRSFSGPEWDTSRKKAKAPPWTREEETTLQEYVDKFGAIWSNETELERRLPGRTPDTCTKHWSLMVQRGDATPVGSPETRLNATIEAARKELVRRRQAFGGMLTPAREGVLEALDLVKERAEASLKHWRSVLVKRAKLGQRQRNWKFIHPRVMAEAAAAVETAEKAYRLSSYSLNRVLRDAEAVSDKYDLDYAKEVAGDNPSEPELAAIAALEKKAEESRAATKRAVEARRLAAANQAVATARASLDAALAADERCSTRATQEAVQTAQAAYDAAFRKTDAGRESAAKEAAATALASLDAARAAHQQGPTDATRTALQEARAAYDEAFSKTHAGRKRLERAKKHQAEVLAAVAIEKTPPEELLSRVAEKGHEVAAYALEEIKNGRVVYIGNSTAGGYEAEIEMVLRRDSFLIKEQGDAPVASSRLKIEAFSCETSAVLANLVERHAQIAVRNECRAEDILYSKAGAGGINCKDVETVVYVFSIAPEAGDKRTPSPFQCDERDLSDLRRAVIAAATAGPLESMPEEHVEGVDVDFYLKKVDGNGLYHVFTRGPWCVRQWKRSPSSLIEFETTRLWPSQEVARAEAEEVFAKRTHANYARGRYEEVGKADYTDDAMETDDSGPLDYRLSDMDTTA